VSNNGLFIATNGQRALLVSLFIARVPAEQEYELEDSVS
jgi:hypothetical protein